MLRNILVGTATAAALACTGTASAAVMLYGITSAQSGGNLVTFNSETPGTFTSRVTITGDVDRGVDLFALDLNSRNNMLYSIGSLGGGSYALFSITMDGVATRIGTNLGLNIGTENTGLDYNAATNRFHIVTNDEQTYVIDPETGVATRADSFAYAAGDPLGQRNPNVVAAAFGDALYVLDRNGPGTGGVLATLNGTTLNSVAAVDRRLNANTSFDIASNGEAYFNDGQVAYSLYLLNLSDGTTVRKGALQERLTGLTAAPGAIPEPATWAMMLAGFALAGSAMRRRRVVVAA